MEPLEDVRPPLWRRLAWSVPWLVFQVFPLLDLVGTPRPLAARLVIAVALIAFTGAYLSVLGRFARPTGVRPDFVVVVVLALALSAGLGTSYAGLWIYVSAAAAASLPHRLVWPVTGAATLASLVVIVSWQDWTSLFLPVLCPLTAATLWGTRHLIVVNAELREAREELARNAVAEERLRFARDLHDVMGRNLSAIAVKSQLAAELARRGRDGAADEMDGVGSLAESSLREVREVVRGYRATDLASELAGARSVLRSAGVATTVTGEDDVAAVPAPVQELLGWVVRESVTNVLRHSSAGRCDIGLTTDHEGTTLTVRDDGAGAPATWGNGLTGLSERLTAGGGRLQAGLADGGFVVRAEVPA